MNSKQNNSRISYIDIAKGISMICIILGHFEVFTIIRIVYTFHVPIFFLISGYFISNKIKMSDFIKGKAKRLLIPFYITCLIIMALELEASFFVGGIGQTFIYWIKAILYAAGSWHHKPFEIIPIGSIWFLWALFWGSIFLRLSLNMKKHMRIIFIGTIFLIGYYTRNIFWLPLSIQPGACATLFMYIGYLIKINKDTIDKISPQIKIVGSFVALIISILFIKNFKTFFLVECDIGRGVIDIIGSLCSCWIVILISQFIDKHTNILKKFFTKIGQHSLILLCVHNVELNILPWFAIPYLISFINVPPFDLISIIIAKILFDILVTKLIIYIKEKNKVKKGIYRTTT